MCIETELIFAINVLKIFKIGSAAEFIMETNPFVKSFNSITINRRIIISFADAGVNLGIIIKNRYNFCSIKNKSIHF